MRRALKIVIPLLVLALIIGGLYAYFFMISPDTTAVMLKNWGDSSAENGNYSRAIRLYELAYELDPGNTDLAFSLATSYSGAQNYTKAEYILLDCIKVNPADVSLYVALSKVFVAQDKLLDAQELLDGGLPEDIGNQLQAMRPAAPTLCQEPGYYSEYVDLEVTAPEGTVYVSLDEEFPSMAGGIFRGATLPGGTTQVTAICVGTNGLVSPLTTGEYTIDGVIEEAVFADAAMEDYVRELLYKSPTQRIMTDELWDITELSLPEAVTTLEDLHYFVGLTSLSISALPDSDLGFLELMPDLSSLTLSGCALTSEQLAALRLAPGLTHLQLANCSLSTLAPLSALTQLAVLDLSDNFISDLTPLSGCTALQELNLQSNGVSDAAPLASLTALRILNLSSNDLKDVSALSACTKLEELYLSGNKLTALDCISSMTVLRILEVAKNQLKNIGSVSMQLERFDASENALESIDGLEQVTTLHYININYNDVKVLPDFSSDCQLQRFYAAHNFLEDISGLSDLPQLNYVDIDYNNVSSVDSLLSCPMIVQINAFGTNVKDISAFKDTSVIVNYNPS